MKKLFLKVLSVMLSLIYVFSSFSISAFAYDDDDYEIVDEDAVLYAPKELSAVLPSGTKSPTIKLTWNDDYHDNYTNVYYIYRRSSSEKKYQLIGKADRITKSYNSAEQSYKDTTVNKNTVYYYKVKSVYYANKKVQKSSDFSNIVSCSSAVNAPVISAESKSSDKITLSWDKVEGADRYYMYYSTSKDGTYKCIGYTKKTSYTLKNLKTSTKYYFKVKAAKVSNNKAYKSIYSNTISTKTLNKNGEYIVDFKKISNKEAGLPTGSAITCLTMMFNHYGLDLSPMEVYEYFDCSTEFYTKNGRLYGPNHRKYFIGDPTSDKAYCYGAEMVYIGDVYKEILATNKNTIKRVQFRDMDSVKRAMCDGHIFFVRVLKRDPNRKCIFWLHEDGFTQMYYDEKYGILCGYTDTDYIVYDPYLDKYERYEWTLEYHLFTSIFSIANE